MNSAQTYQQLLTENERLRTQLEEATEIIQAIRTGQIDALVVEGKQGHELYTLKTADHLYRVIIETMNEGALTLNEHRLIVYCNATFASLIGMPLSAVVGLPFDQFIAPDHREAYQELFRADGWENQKAELSLASRTGKEVPCLLSLTALTLDEGTSLSVILTDLTAQQEIQRLLKVNNEQLGRTNAALEISNTALNRSNDDLQRFAYVASHDLQEPLRKIQQFGSLLKLRYADRLDEQGADWIDRMERAAVRMSGLIRDVLAYSSLKSHLTDFVEQPLNDIVADVLSSLELQIQEKAATIEISELGHVPGEAPQLAQAFQNLLSNALKFGKADTPTHIRISRQPVSRPHLPPLYNPLNIHKHFCAIEVADNGIGFDAHQAERIFGTFQRLHGKSQYPGTGIGLAIVKKVVENHYGYVTARSEPGQGATFTIYLPV